jgi:AcrR family transcriptional regulator
MARTLDPAAHALRRDAFVDAAQRLMQAKGYEEMTIQDVLDDLETSRGAFYHYFDSKAALLDAVVERMVDDATTALVPVIDAPGLPATMRLARLFNGLAQWKSERTDLLHAVMETWVAEENAIVREKFRRGVRARMTPLLATIIEQGVVEGTMTAGPPEQVAIVLVSMILGANETATDLYFARQAGTVTFDHVVRTLEAYPAACERILGLPAGSFPVPDRSIFRQWFG